jgi:hypothetical protein
MKESGTVSFVIIATVVGSAALPSSSFAAAVSTTTLLPDILVLRAPREVRLGWCRWCARRTAALRAALLYVENETQGAAVARAIY